MNILDYLDWRGDLSFAASQPNEVDALIFSWLVYYRFENLKEESFDGMTLAELAALHERIYGPFQKINLTTTIDPAITGIWLLHRVSCTRRFAQVRICDFSQKQSGDIQFAAISFVTEDRDGDLRVIAYRGTDDSIAGWKEDCYLAISDKVPAQETALHYLEETADGRRALVCGHSKGGNLAVYAALFASEERVKDICFVYNFDGPGFCFDIRSMERYRLLRDRIATIVPESSVIGMLLEHEDEYCIVESRGIGLLQHDAMFWQVLGKQFVYADKRNESSLIADKALRDWLDSLSVEERREFVDAVFGILEGTGAVRTTELPEKLVQDGFRSLIRSPLSSQQKKMMIHVLLKLIKAGNASLYDSMTHSEAWGKMSAFLLDKGISA